MPRHRIIQAGTLAFVAAVLGAQALILGHARGKAALGELPVLHLRGGR